MKRYFFLSTFFVFCLVVYLCSDYLTVLASPVVRKLRGPFSVQQRLEQYGQISRARWLPYFEKAKVTYPPAKVLFLGLKKERLLEVYAPGVDGNLKFIKGFPVCAASGTNGPKLKEGDLQVPEGIYRISFLNPNSAYHLSLRVNYPNEFDRAKGKLDGRSNLGGDIMIHGNCLSIGCLAMQNQAAEDLFVLAADVGIPNSKVVLAPFDFRSRKLSESDFQSLPSWTPELYQLIQREFDHLPER